MVGRRDSSWGTARERPGLSAPKSEKMRSSPVVAMPCTAGERAETSGKGAAMLWSGEICVIGHDDA